MSKACLVIVTKFLFLLLLNLGALNVHLRFVVGCHEAEREALFKFKHSLVHPNNSLPSWEGVDCCHWEGVGCDNVTAYVNRLDLHNPFCDPYAAVPLSSLVAPNLNPALLALKYLHYLDLSCNDFQGSQIPGYIGSFKHLRYLNMAVSNFSGAVPSQLGNLSRLQNLDLSDNADLSSDTRWVSKLVSLQYLNMSGIDITESRNPMHTLTMLPSLIGLGLSSCRLGNTKLYGLFSNLTWLSRIQQLDLSSNYLQGPLPHIFPNMTSLTYLDLSKNNFDGSIPLSMRSMRNLEYLDLSDNSFRGVEGGAVIGLLGNLCKLKTLDLANNSIGGEMGVHRNLSECITYDLETLQLGYNMIGGTLPNWLGDFKYMGALDVSDNRFGGPIPASIGSLAYLAALILSNNNITGRLLPPSAKKIGFSLCDLPSLAYLRLQNNKLSGYIPDCWGNMEFTIFIDLSLNQFSGNIPMSLGLHSELILLKLNNNALEGHIPLALKNCTQLRLLDLSENKLSGKIVNRITKRSTLLTILRLRGNQFEGIIPPQLCSLPSLQNLDLADNKLTGNIPHCLGSITKMGPSFNDFKDQYLDENAMIVLKGDELEYSKTLRFVVNLDLSCNHLTGTIPFEITNLSALIGLNLSLNHLTGNIPNKIGEMRSLESLDLSNNNLSGTIPPSISALTAVVLVNLSYNQLHGQIPTGHQLQVIEHPAMAYIGNPGLCGDPLPKECNPSHAENQLTQEPDVPEKEDDWENPLFYFVIFSGFATGFWGIVGSLLLKRRFRFALFQTVGVSLISSMFK